MEEPVDRSDGPPLGILGLLMRFVHRKDVGDACVGNEPAPQMGTELTAPTPPADGGATAALGRSGGMDAVHANDLDGRLGENHDGEGPRADPGQLHHLRPCQ